MTAHPTKPSPMREGFWFSEDEPRLPIPIGADHPWTGLAWFVQCLQKLEVNLQPVAYRGSSRCRLCGQRNGNEEFNSSGWKWPSGYRHYIEDHNVRPSLAFQEFVLGREVRGRNAKHFMRVIERNAVKEILEADTADWLATAFASEVNYDKR